MNEVSWKNVRAVCDHWMEHKNPVAFTANDKVICPYVYSTELIHNDIIMWVYVIDYCWLSMCTYVADYCWLIQIILGLMVYQNPEACIQIPYASSQYTMKKNLTVTRAYVSYHTRFFLWNLITHPRRNFNGALVKIKVPRAEVRTWMIIISHASYGRLLLIHARNSMLA